MGSSPSTNEHLARFMIWVDGVGGYLVCCDKENSIGQATEDSEVSIPISGDIHRSHASILSDADAHLLHPIGPVSVDGRPLKHPTVLKDRQTFMMGGSVALGYRKPHPWSSSAVIRFESGNRTFPWSDAVIIAGDTVVLGPNAQSHIRCTRWEQEVFLLRREGRWYCRSFADFSIDGEAIKLEGGIHGKSRIEGRDFSFSIESLDPQ